MKSDRLGLLMIAASMVAIAVVVSLTWRQQAALQSENTRTHGVAIARALSGMESSDDDARPVPDEVKLAMMRSLVNVQSNRDLSYLVSVAPDGAKLHEYTSPGSIVPAAVMPTEPYGWFGEHDLVSPGDGRPIRDFFAPIVKAGHLAGFVRAGYYRHEGLLPGNELPTLALVALPVFMLTILSYFLIRRELRPLQWVAEKMEAVASVYDPAVVTVASPGNHGEFIERFDRFIKLVQARVENLNSRAVASQTNSRLVSYKQEKAESALNSLPDAVLVLDDSGLPTFANQKIESFLNRGREAIVGKPLQEWCDNKDVLSFLLRHKHSSSSILTSTLEYAPAAAADRRTAISAIPLFSPRDRSIVFGTLFVFRDISREHAASHAGADFVAQVAHELKTPLHALMGYSELLLDRATLSEAEQVRAVNVIHAEVGRMTDLINNLLNISKMESGSLKPERKRVKLHELMREAFAGLQNSSLGKGVELELAVPADLGSVRLDKELFRIAIDNLLSNAVKYSDPGGKVTVSACALEDGQIQIRVRDHGIGIAPGDLARVFTKHYRADNPETAARSGHGLGLFLAKQIVELHHGNISVSSELGKGTEFVIGFKAQTVQLEVTESS